MLLLSHLSIHSRGKAPTYQKKILPGPKDDETGEPAYVDYLVKLLERSLNEFSFWVNRHMQNAHGLAPVSLAAKQHQAALALVQKYEQKQE